MMEKFCISEINEIIITPVITVSEGADHCEHLFVCVCVCVCVWMCVLCARVCCVCERDRAEREKIGI